MHAASEFPVNKRSGGTSSVFSIASSATSESMTTVSTSRSSTYDSGIAKQEEISKKAEQMEYLKIKFTTLAGMFLVSSFLLHYQIFEGLRWCSLLPTVDMLTTASHIDSIRFQTRLVDIQYGSIPSKSTSPLFKGFAFPTRPPQASGATQFEAMASSSSSRKSSSSTGKGNHDQTSAILERL
jgi:hypothetical protein